MVAMATLVAYQRGPRNLHFMIEYIKN